MKRAIAGLLGGLLLLASFGCAEPLEEAYEQSILEWREGRAESLTRPDGWTSLVALYWLEEGENSFGAGSENALVLPEGSTAERAGIFGYDGTTVNLTLAEGVEGAIGGLPAIAQSLAPDTTTGGPDLLEIGRLTFSVIDRGGRHAIRIKDPQSPARRDFAGIDYFPISPEFRIEARLARADEPRELSLPTVVQTQADFLVLGEVEFSLRGESLRLQALVSDPEDDELFIIFKDATSGKETYGAGRYLVAPLLAGDRVELDFNRSYNPPCAFTPFATCPLPPRENHLPVEVTAGEKDYHR